MMERLNIWFTRTHSSVTVVEDGATRETSSRTMAQTIANMGNDDRELLARFCLAVIECTNGNGRRLSEW